jgi:hypothetical protein
MCGLELNVLWTVFYTFGGLAISGQENLVNTAFPTISINTNGSRLLLATFDLISVKGLLVFERYSPETWPFIRSVSVMTLLYPFHGTV